MSLFSYFSKKKETSVKKVEASKQVEQTTKKVELPTFSGQILTARPDGMSFKEYKEQLKAQKQWIKERKKGFLVYRSSVVLTDPNDKTKKRIQTFHPFEGVASSLKPV